MKKPSVIYEKPLTVNQAWQGRRFKTPKYKNYEELLLDTLPNEIWIPDDSIELIVEFGVSNKMQDIDNGLKPLLDILQKKYDFNDNRIYGLCVNKTITNKGEEYSKFVMNDYDPDWWKSIWKS